MQDPFRRLRQFLVCSFVVAGLTFSVAARAEPSPFDLSATLTALDQESTPQAVKRLEALPPAALSSIYAALDKNDLSSQARNSINEALPSIVARNLRTRLDMDKRLDADWNRRTGIEVYKTSPAHNPAWDAIVVDALASSPLDPAAAYRKFKAAIDAGCNDPLVRYYYAKRGYLSNSLPLDKAIDIMTSVVNDLETSGYSPGRQFFGHVFLGTLLLNQSTSSPDMARANFDKCLALLPQLPPEHPGLSAMSEAVIAIYSHCQELNYDRKQLFDKMNAALTTLFPDRYFPHAFASQFYLDWAWDGARLWLCKYRHRGRSKALPGARSAWRKRSPRKCES